MPIPRDEDGNGDGDGDEGGQSRESGDSVGNDCGNVGEGRAMKWGGACLPLAFKCLQLVVDDFLERVPHDQVRPNWQTSFFPLFLLFGNSFV